MDGTSATPEGVFSLLDTDLYKLTMQSAILKYFPQVHVTYGFTNRNPEMKFTRQAFNWLQKQIDRLSGITVSQQEIGFLRDKCTFLSEQYLYFLQSFRLKPREHLKTRFVPDQDDGHDQDTGSIEMTTDGLWVETILYEIPLLALTSEAYFKFVDRDWTYDGQLQQARDKGRRLIEAGCVVSEFGTRRRRDFHTLDLVMQGLVQANKDAEGKGHKGKIAGTSNVYMAMKYDLVPTGTIAHEWFMGVAAVTDSYVSATEAALSYWIGTFGVGVLGVALTDTFGTESFLKSFVKPIVRFTATDRGAATTLASSASGPGVDSADNISTTEAPIQKTSNGQLSEDNRTYAEVFTGVRQDSGDPLEFVSIMKTFYTKNPPKSPKSITFSDSLNVDKCIEYQKAAEDAGFIARFGVGTFLSNDYVRASTGEKSKPLNIVIKLSSADGKPAIKISDNLGKNTGDRATVEDVKRQLGYTEREWRGGDESRRWD